MTEYKEIKTKDKTNIINIKKSELNKIGYLDLEHWLKDSNHVYIGRDMSFYVKGAKGSIWKNPYKVSKSSKTTKSKNKKTYSLDESLELYKSHIENDQELVKLLPTLKNKTLGCWCKPNKCHGDILIELINKYC